MRPGIVYIFKQYIRLELLEVKSQILPTKWLTFIRKSANLLMLIKKKVIKLFTPGQYNIPEGFVG